MSVFFSPALVASPLISTAVAPDVSDSVTGYHYDDEPDSIVVTTKDGDTIRVSPEESPSHPRVMMRGAGSFSHNIICASEKVSLYLT